MSISRHTRIQFGNETEVAPLPWKSGSYQSDTGSLGNNVKGHDLWGEWRGRTDALGLYFITGDTWSRLTDTSLWGLYKGSKYANETTCISIGFFPYDNTSTMAQAAAGEFDAHYVKMGKKMMENNLEKCYLRPAWEYNGGYQWQGTANAEEAANYRKAWQRMVTIIRAQGWKGKTVFCMQVLQQLGTVTPNMCYPGDDYVDVIGPDWYDQGSSGDPVARFAGRRDGEFGARYWAEFCRAGAERLDSSPEGVMTTNTKAKTYCIPEWGLRNDDYPRPNGDRTGNGGDSPYYIRAMYEFLMDVHNSGITVEFESYFNKDHNIRESHKIVQGLHDFSNAAREYQRLFGGG